MSNYLLLVLAMISWGLSNPLADLAVSGLSAATQTVLEIGSGFLIITLFYFFQPKIFRNRELKNVSWRIAAVLGAVQPGFAWLAGNYGYTVATASTGVILLNLEALFTVIIATLWLKERIVHFEFFALLIGIIGAVLGSFDQAGISIKIGLGALCFLLSSILCGTNAVAVKKLGVGINPINLAFRQTLWSFVYVLIWWLIFDRGHFSGQSNEIYLAGVLSGVFGVALPIVAFNYAAARVRSSHVAVLFNIVPTVGVVGAIILGRGAPTWIQLIGGGFVLVSIWILRNSHKAST